MTRNAGPAAGFVFNIHKSMKPRSIKPLLLVCALLIPVVHGQDETENIRGIERKVLLKQRQEAVQSVIGAAKEVSKGDPADTRDLVGKQLQWLTLVNNRIGEGGKISDAESAEAVRSATMVNDMAWSLVISADEGARRPETALKLVTFAIELGGHDKALRPRMLDTRARALFLLGRNAEAIAEQGEAVAAAQPGEERAGLEATLDSYQKNELPEVAQPTAAEEPSSGVYYITGKLRTIVIPSVDFDDVSLEEAVDSLRKQALALDTAELDPGRKGVNFVIRRPRLAPASQAAPGEAPPAAAVDIGSLRIKALHLRNVPLAVALKYLCDVTRCRYKVDDFAVTLVPMDDGPEDIFTRVFRVSPDFVSNIASGAGVPLDSNPPTAPVLINVFKAAGVVFDNGSSAILAADGILMVTNTPSQLDKIEQLVATMTPNRH